MMKRFTIASMLLRRVGCLALCLAFSHAPLWARSLNTGASFLRIDTGARPSAMGGAYTAIANDVNAMYYNPGGLAHLTRRELGATHAQWLLNTTFDFIGYAQPTTMGTFGLGVTRLGVGAQSGRGPNRQETGGFAASDTAYALGFSRRGAFSSGHVGLGGSMKYLQSAIGEYSASAVAFDAGAQYRPAGSPLSLGMSVLNVGQGMKFLDQVDPLPLSVGIGAAYRFGAGALQVALDVRQDVYDQETSVSLGTEYAVLPTFSVRAGYASSAARQSGASAGAFGGLGGGFGLKLGSYRADYTFTPFGQLGNAQRLSIGARF